MHKPLCLIADSDQQHAEWLQALCEERGCRADVHVVPNNGEGTEAQRADLLKSLASDDVDIAFLDASLGRSSLIQLADDGLSEAELFVMADVDQPEVADACIRAGFSYYFCKPAAASGAPDLLDDVIEELRSASERSPDTGSNQSLDQFGMIRGSSRAMRKLFRVLRKVGPTHATVLVVGESGTGKELIAETLHTISDRSEGPYLTLNCSALAENLIESELFGHEKGSFSGAHKRHLGFFERADGGTLFLDEITEMNPDLQSKLLRALESGEIRRVGSAEPIEVNVRVIAATNRDPMVAVDEGLLREDLYYRLAHILVHVPSLRRRGSDVGGLAHYFLQQLNEEHETTLRFSDEALEAISEYEWPGNVRQLRHAVERAYIISDSTIEKSALDLRTEIVSPASRVSDDVIQLTVGTSLADCEREIIMANLKHFDGDKKETARVLGVSVKTLYNRLRDYSELEAVESSHDRLSEGSVRVIGEPASA